mmetsp:Transcript_10254/g.24628  ORF Transcript_10254/g.24628 Transcript_10254/m.24628 type:complete len:91 (+) Transcript_10254:850-1122(+)
MASLTNKDSLPSGKSWKAWTLWTSSMPVMVKAHRPVEVLTKLSFRPRAMRILNRVIHSCLISSRPSSSNEERKSSDSWIQPIIFWHDHNN